MDTATIQTKPANQNTIAPISQPVLVLGIVLAFAEERDFRVDVDVDKTRADDAILCVDHRACLCAVQSADRGDPIALHCDVCAKGRAVAAAVNDASVLDDTVELHA